MTYKPPQKEIKIRFWEKCDAKMQKSAKSAKKRLSKIFRGKENAKMP